MKKDNFHGEASQNASYLTFILKCSKTYAQIKARNRHMLNDHTENCKRDDAYYPCDTCSAIFVSILGREKHVKRMHPVRTNIEGNTFSCPFSCGDPPRSFEK